MVNDSTALFTYIENKIIESIQKYCQWQLYLQLIHRVSEHEERRLKEFVQPEMLAQIQKHAPLHYKYLYCPLFCNLTNDLYNALFRQEEYLKMTSEMPDKACYWPTITYNELKASGFDEQFAKKEINSLVENKKLKQKKGSWGYKYSLQDVESLSSRIKYVKAGIRFEADGYTDLIFDEAWIYEQFSEKSIDSIFENIKNIVFEKIREGTTLNDEVE